jgi:conjugal transfer pilus assembly protein TraV
MKRLILSTFLVALLTGCASLNSRFDCPMKPGVMCKSLDEVNDMVDQGKLGGHQDHNAKPAKHLTAISPVTTGASLNHPSHCAERVSRIWIAPYEDTGGDYYGSTFVYRVTPHQAVSSVNCFKDEGASS